MTDRDRADHNAASLGLLAKFVEQNTADAAYNANWQIDMAQKEAVEMARAFVQLFKAIDNVQVVDRRLLQAQTRLFNALDHAEMIIDKWGSDE